MATFIAVQVTYESGVIDGSLHIIALGMQSSDKEEIFDYCRHRNSKRYPAWCPCILRENGIITTLRDVPLRKDIDVKPEISHGEIRPLVQSLRHLIDDDASYSAINNVLTELERRIEL